MYLDHPYYADHKLYVVTAISNPRRFASRYRLYENFAKHIRNSGAELVTVEIAMGDRNFQVTDCDNPHHLRLRTWHEIWHKENAINLGVQHLGTIKPGWQYVAWIDADITFCRPDWVEETLHALQHHHVVQMFSHAHDMGPDETIFDTYPGFVWSYQNRQLESWNCEKGDYYVPFGWHPGYGWAWNRDALDSVGGLLDIAILGSADQHMARALVGRGRDSINPRMHSGYLAAVDRWQDLAERHIRRDIGYVPGSIVHHWHGRKKDRGYLDRWKILRDLQYDPTTDLKRDSNGLYQLVDVGDERSIELRDKVRRYFAARNEDSIDMEEKP